MAGIVRVIDVSASLNQAAIIDLSKEVRRLPRLIALEQLELALKQGTVGITACALPRMMLRDEL
ncbi:MAG TPA: hypothetical protein VGN70_07535, partial [Gammaproteobacteria bacterium]